MEIHLKLGSISRKKNGIKSKFLKAKDYFINIFIKFKKETLNDFFICFKYLFSIFRMRQ